MLENPLHWPRHAATPLPVADGPSNPRQASQKRPQRQRLLYTSKRSRSARTVETIQLIFHR